MLKYYLPNLVISYIGVKITWNLFNIIYAVGYLMSFFLWWKKKRDLPRISKITCKLFKKYREPSKAFYFPRRGKGVPH